ncbi:MAG: hypothetical protein EZS28_054234, partial [Streblomastix strix]
MERIVIGQTIINELLQTIIIEVRLKTSPKSQKITLKSQHLDQGQQMLIQAMIELRQRIRRSGFMGGLAVPLFINEDGTSALSATDISALVRNMMQLAGINSDDYGAYSAKSAGISNRIQESIPFQVVASQANLSLQSGVIQKHYIKPIENYTAHRPSITHFKQSHSPQKARLPDYNSRPSPERSGSLVENEANEANANPVNMDLRQRDKIS